MTRFVIIFCVLIFSFSSAQQKSKDYSNILKSDNIYELDGFLKFAHPDDPRRMVIKPKLMDLLKDYIKKAKPEDQRLKMMQEKLALLRSRPSTLISFDEMNDRIRQKHIRYLQKEIAEGRISYADVKDSPYLEQLKKGSEYTIYKTERDKQNNLASAHNNPEIVFEDTEKEEFAQLMKSSTEELKNKTTQVLNSLFNTDIMSKDAIVLIENNSSCNLIMRIEGAGNIQYRLPIPAHNENSIVIKKGNYLFNSVICGAQYSSQKTVEKAVIVQLDNPKQLTTR